MKVDSILLILRVAFGGMLLAGHGIPKAMNFAELSATFPDPLGIGSQISLGMALFAEVLCSTGVILGIMTRLAAIPPLVMMVVALTMVHGEDLWQKKELAVVYAVPFACLIIAGGGRFAIDQLRGRTITS